MVTACQREGESGMPADSPETPPSSSRAGRDLPAAIGVGLVLGAAVVLSLLMVRYLFIGIVAAAVAVATVELAGALRSGAGSLAPQKHAFNHDADRLMACLSGFLMVFATFKCPTLFPVLPQWLSMT